MSKWFPSILAAVSALLAVFNDPIQHAISAHPAVSAVLASIGAILAHLAPQPQK